LTSVARAQWHLRAATRVPFSVRLDGRLLIRNNGTITFGDRVLLASRAALQEFRCGPGAVIELGSGTFVNHGTSIVSCESVRIGRECRIGTYCLIADNQLYRLEPERRNERPESRPITIEDHVWIAARVIVLPGVTIGAGSVVAAGSVVTHDVPPRTLVAGVPARAVRSL
jgi:maltose O-acetyltransferase